LHSQWLAHRTLALHRAQVPPNVFSHQPLKMTLSAALLQLVWLLAVHSSLLR